MPRHKAEWFGPRLRELREAAGLTQTALGERAGIVGSQINKLELGVNQPTLATSLALARALGVEVTAFVPSEETAPPAKGQGKAAGEKNPHRKLKSRRTRP